MSLYSRWCAVLITALLTACAAPGPRAPDADAPAAFDLGGRVSVRNQERVFTASLRWRQAAGSDEIWLNSPLGQTIAYLQADDSGATLTSADQKKYRASSMESLTRSALGWRFPVASLRYWVLGQTAPGMSLDQVERDGAGRLLRFRQDGLEVDFSYAEADAKRLARIDVASETARIRLVIDSLTLIQQ